MTLHIGGTASRHGLTKPQLKVAYELLIGFWLADRDLVFHHGDCVGGDDELAGVVDALPGAHVEAHPGNDPRLRAHHKAWVAHHPRAFLARNEDIVTASAKIIAFPHVAVDPGRGSGTWWTIRHATRRDPRRPVCVVLPDGTWSWR